MKPPDLSRLHALRMNNDAHRYEMQDNATRFATLAKREAPRIVTAWQLFQTPADLAARMVELAEPSPHLHWLEPSAGLGRILRPIMATDPATVTACEIAPQCAAELYREFPDTALIQRDFLDVRPPREGNCCILKDIPNRPPFFNRIVMNPPFHMRADVRHILHAVQFLATGGVLVALAMATHHRETALRELCDHWEKLDGGTFASAGTRVETYLMRIRRH